MDFKVKCVGCDSNSLKRFTVGKVYDVVNHRIVDDTDVDFTAWSLPMNGKGDFESLKNWFSRYYDFELVEDKKVFTKNDLKTGMFGVMNNGFKFVIVNDHLVYDNGEWDMVDSLNSDLRMYSKKVMKVYDNLVCFKELECTTTCPVYDRERDTKPLYNGKVVCIDATINQNLYTVGKIYQFKDGRLTGDNGKPYPEESIFSFDKIYTFEDWKNWSSSKWLEIKE